MKRQLSILFSLLIGIALASCNRDKDEAPTPVVPPDEQHAWTVCRTDGFDGETRDLAYMAGYESITVSIAGRTGETRTVVVASDSQWLSVSSDTLAVDSIVALATLTNNTGRRRNATLIFADADNPSLSASLTLTQLSASDLSNNGADARQDLYIGYGYDIYKALESPMSVKTIAPIIDLDFLRTQNDAARYDVIQDCRLARTEVRYVASNTLQAHSEKLTTMQTGNSTDRIAGCRENCITANAILNQENSGKIEQQYIGHGMLEKTVASRVIDRAAILDLQRQRNVPFTDEYLNRLWRIRDKSGSERSALIEQTLLDFGTHLIIQADLGGRIDYTFTMQKAASFYAPQEMEEEINYTLGRITSQERQSAGKPISSSKSTTGAITIHGGSQATRQKIEDDIRGLSPTGQIDPDQIIDWLASINYSDNPAADPNLDVIRFELIPIWDLVWDELRNDFRNVTMRLVQRSDCALPNTMLGTDIYEISTKKERALFDFQDEDENSTLCRILYYEGEPVLQVCSEYVPKIRTDKRVVVAYPIYKQHIRLNQGIFIGDGIHPPSYVGFSGSECYVSAIEDTEPGDILQTFWYVNGSLLPKNPTGVSGLKGKKKQIMDDYLTLYTDNVDGAQYHQHPIVKVGTKFWTRNDIHHRMMFAEYENSTSILDQMTDGMLYTMFQFVTNYEFNKHNGWTWGYTPNTYYPDSPNMKWYLPTESDVKGLYRYLGFNPKALFKGEVSGWDAEFNGYYGAYDLKNKNKYFADKEADIRYKGTLNVICSKNSEDDEDACLMVLDNNYAMQLIDDKTFKTTSYRYFWRNNFYPVRPVRGYMYEYPLLSVINEHVRK